MGTAATHLRTSLATALATLAALPGAALAQSSAGGAYPGEPPTVSGVTCRLACAGLDRAAAGSTVRLAGEAMDGATRVVFLGGRGRADDRGVPVAGVTPTSVDAVVPPGALTGRVRVIGATGQLSKASTRSVVIGEAAAAGAPLVEARVDSKRVFVDGRRKPSLSFFVGGAAAARVRIDLVRDGAPAPVATWTPGEVAAGTVQTVEWDASRAPAVEQGRYEFRVSADTPGSQPAQAAQAAPAATSGFLLLTHIFPVRGRHDFGQFAAAFGGGRGHQGQDVFARCGTPLVAARGGTVKHKAFQARAGNYVVVATEDGVDHAYMHLRDPALVEKGDAIATGQQLGHVGATGRAHGCHLHFEQWSAPGWYTGGTAADPLPDLLAWDRVS